ncbi:hypothetical protein CLAFUW4_02143 [Fulvia fulva]|nr:hypothetical protein CLAFUR4_02139 [Fulvia fulva]KAK4638124.1 hypothetical protein CLAFUR0_02142 [Fulvia fulva]WPV10106.1 hypothetical protein CLAFUW4_02143 [Fulvia fulva]WPV24808.1 hypothetical protein CLAFUW7_02143 [Fulvia fulva]
MTPVSAEPIFKPSPTPITIITIITIINIITIITIITITTTTTTTTAFARLASTMEDIAMSDAMPDWPTEAASTPDIDMLVDAPSMPTLDELRQYIGPNGRQIKKIWARYEPTVTKARHAEFEQMLLAIAEPASRDGVGLFRLKPEELVHLEAAFNENSSTSGAPSTTVAHGPQANATAVSVNVETSSARFPPRDAVCTYIWSQPGGRVHKKDLLRHYRDAIVARHGEFVKMVAEVAQKDRDGYLKLK